MSMVLISMLLSLSAFAKPSAKSSWMAEKLPDQGALFYALRRVLEKKNYELKVIFAPSWIRAKMDAVKNPEID